MCYNQAKKGFHFKDDKAGDGGLTEKELKKMNRYQLLELLVMQTERADALQKKVDELEEQLEKREIHLSQLGSIAEAAMHLSGVFEAAQKAADLYLDSAKKQADDILESAHKKRKQEKNQKRSRKAEHR